MISLIRLAFSSTTLPASCMPKVSEAHVEEEGEDETHHLGEALFVRIALRMLAFSVAPFSMAATEVPALWALVAIVDRCRTTK